MARYHVDSRQAVTPAQTSVGTGYKTMVTVFAATATLCRGRSVGIAVGADGAPNATDCQIVYAVQRQTVDGTGVASTANPIVPGDVASRSVSKINYTIEGTYTLPIWTRALNQRASMQWTAPDTDASLLWPATNAAGLALMALSPTYAAPVLCGFEYEDM